MPFCTRSGLPFDYLIHRNQQCLPTLTANFGGQKAFCKRAMTDPMDFFALTFAGVLLQPLFVVVSLWRFDIVHEVVCVS